MKKLTVLCLLIIIVTVFQFCSATRKAAKVEPVKINYTTHVQPLVLAHCAPCHFPPKGNKLPLDTYAGMKGDIDDVIDRIKKQPGEKGFMPFKHPRLPDSTINVFVQWKADGLLEK